VGTARCQRSCAIRRGYHHRGRIRHYDAYPEVENGDIDTLKDYANNDDEIGSAVINVLIKAHCYWIREADVDGFRVDAVSDGSWTQSLARTTSRRVEM
jgi:1,4-alpha-glucan branching enzyme